MHRPDAALIAALLVFAGGVGAGAALGGGSAAVTIRGALVEPVGKTVLVTGSGSTLYRNAAEKGGRIRCTAACATTWPPLLVRAGDRLVAGAGVAQSKLGTVRRPDGRRQATYSGWPLYRFAADRRGQAKGQGLAGIWFVIAVAGPSPPSTTAPATTAAPPTDTGYGYPK